MFFRKESKSNVSSISGCIISIYVLPELKVTIKSDTIQVIMSRTKKIVSLRNMPP